LAYQLPPLAWLRSFEASARHSSFSAAAGELNLTPAAVSHQARCLERHLGHALFERLPRGVRLTAIGRAYLPSVRRAFDELSVSTMGLFGAGPGAAVALRAPVSFAALRLAPRLPDFRADHPEIHLQLSAAIWADALSADEVDLDIRFGDGRWSDFEAVSLGPESSILVSSPAFAASAGDGLDALGGSGVIQIMGCEDLWAQMIGQAGGTGQGVEVAKVDNSLLGLELAAAGMGCLLVLRSLAAPYLAAGRLIEPMPSLRFGHDQSHFILTPKDRRQSRPEAKLVRDWLLRDLSGDDTSPSEAG